MLSFLFFLPYSKPLSPSLAITPGESSLQPSSPQEDGLAPKESCLDPSDTETTLDMALEEVRQAPALAELLRPHTSSSEQRLHSNFGKDGASRSRNQHSQPIESSPHPQTPVLSPSPFHLAQSQLHHIP